MLKISHGPEEQRGNALMVCWSELHLKGGRGVARVLAHHGPALLLERATGDRSLAAMARSGLDTEASRIICQVAAKLHTAKLQPLPDLVPLEHWFAELEPAALRYGGILLESLAVHRELLKDPQDVVVLHGDIHHGNILDAGPRGWLAIDPKGLRGERGFDFANLFCNPDLPVAASPGRLAKQATVVSQAAVLDRRRLLQWILAYAGLSAAWSLGVEREDPQIALTIAQMAAYELEPSEEREQQRQSAVLGHVPVSRTKHPRAPGSTLPRGRRKF